jgi:hypothetical protein
VVADLYNWAIFRDMGLAEVAGSLDSILHKHKVFCKYKTYFSPFQTQLCLLSFYEENRFVVKVWQNKIFLVKTFAKFVIFLYNKNKGWVYGVF